MYIYISRSLKKVYDRFMHILVNFVPDVSHRVADNHLFRSVRYICSMLASNAVTFYKITLSLLNQRVILYQHSYDRCTNILASELHKKPGKIPWKKIGKILARSSYIPFELFVAKSTENLAFFDEILFVQKICLRGKKRRAALAEVFSRIRGTSAVQKKLGNFPARDDCNYSKRRSVEFEHRLSAPDGRCNDSDKSF